MSEFINIQDRIDEYIRGTMSDKERTIFEEELRQSAALRHEVEVQSSIADAVQAVHLKEVFRGIEAEMAPRETKTVFPTFPRKSVYRFAFAFAALAVLFVFGNNWRQMHRMRVIGNDCYASLVIPTSRGGDAVDSLIAVSYLFLGAEEYEAAKDVLSKAEVYIEDGLQSPVVDEETQYWHDLLESKKYDIEWYQSILIMMQGKYREAKVFLLKISDSQSPYAKNAQSVLERMFNIKPKFT